MKYLAGKARKIDLLGKGTVSGGSYVSRIRYLFLKVGNEHLSGRQLFFLFFLRLVKEDSLFKDVDINSHNFRDNDGGLPVPNYSSRTILGDITFLI